MNEPENSLFFRVFFRAVRIWGGVFMVFTAVGAVGLAFDESSSMDPGLRWGLVGLFAILSVLGALMIFAPAKRKKQSGEDRNP